MAARARSIRKQRTVAIGTWPTPELPPSFKVPPSLMEQFGKDLRVVYRPFPLTGIPVPERLVGQELRKALGGDMEVFLVPKK